MALVDGGFLHYRDIKKFLKNLLLQNCWSDFELISQEFSLGDLFRSDFELISQEFSLGDLFQNCSRNFDLSINMALVNGGFSHYRDMKKFLKNLLLRNCWSDFEIISQEYSFLHYMDMKKFLKNHFLQTRLSDFEIISQECSLGDTFQKLFAKF